MLVGMLKGVNVLFTIGVSRDVRMCWLWFRS